MRSKISQGRCDSGGCMRCQFDRLCDRSLARVSYGNCCPEGLMGEQLIHWHGKQALKFDLLSHDDCCKQPIAKNTCARHPPPATGFRPEQMIWVYKKIANLYAGLKVK